MVYFSVMSEACSVKRPEAILSARRLHNLEGWIKGIIHFLKQFLFISKNAQNYAFRRQNTLEVIKSYKKFLLILKMRKLFKVIPFLAILRAGYIIMPLNLNDDISDLKDIAGYWSRVERRDWILENVEFRAETSPGGSLGSVSLLKKIFAINPYTG